MCIIEDDLVIMQLDLELEKHLKVTLENDKHE